MSLNIFKSNRDALYRFLFIKRIATIIPYHIGVQIFSFFARQQIVHKLFFKKHTRLLRKYMKMLEIKGDVHKAYSCYISCNFISAWRMCTLAKLSDKKFNEWVTVKGIEQVLSFKDKKIGVVLCNSHFGTTKGVLLPLIRMNISIHSFDRNNIFEIMRIKGSECYHSINLDRVEVKTFFLKEMSKASNLLKDGGILHLACDGYRGLSGSEIEFLGRMRRFPNSFATLAVSTNSVVIPVISEVGDDGKILIEFLEPLKIDKKLSNSDNVNSLVFQYRDLLEKHWIHNPGNISKYELHTYLELPLLN